MSENKDEPQHQSAAPLEYRSPETTQRVWRGTDLVLGISICGVWIAIVALCMYALAQIPNFNQSPTPFIGTFVVLFIGVLFVLYKLDRDGRRAIVPGCLIGAGLAILLGAGICALVMKNI